MPGTFFEVVLKFSQAEALRARQGRIAWRPRFPRAAEIAIAMMLLGSMSCAAMEPALRNIIDSPPTPQVERSWSVVEISKPAPTQVRATPTAKAEEQATPTALPEPSPTPGAEETPIISMEIVEEDPPALNPGIAPATANTGPKYILVSISEQHLYAYEHGQLVFSFVASTGMGNSTRAGTFQVLDKIPNAYGANWNIWMPDWLGIYWSGSLENGIHALPILPGGGRLWAGFLGRPISYGCVVLGVEEAMQLYEWADVGTPVEIQW